MAARPTTNLTRRALLTAVATAPLAAACSRASSVEAPSTTGARSVSRVVPSLVTREGAGVRVRRTLGGRALSELDPFLLLDEIHSSDPADYEAGFPTHPHRGFETVSYVIEGGMEHKDSLGNGGLIGAGAAQWMTAGRGIVHSEMPQSRGGPVWALQLWVNLPAREKMRAPRYQDIVAARIPEVGAGGAKVRVVAGAVGATRGPVSEIVTRPLLLDVAVDGASDVELAVDEAHSAFVYVLDGTARLGPEAKAVPSGALAVLGGGSSVLARRGSKARMLVVAAQAIGEPIARRGPFVMNSEAELDQAVLDYRSGRLAAGS